MACKNQVLISPVQFCSNTKLMMTYLSPFKMKNLAVFLTFISALASRSTFNPPFYPHLAPQLYYSPPLPIIPRHRPLSTFVPSDSIQTLLGSLTKIEEVPKFTCTKEGTFPNPLDCSKYYHCDKDLKVRVTI